MSKLNNVTELQDKESVLRLIGRKTPLKLTCLIDGIVDYSSCIPISIDGILYDFRLSLYYYGQDLLNYEYATDLLSDDSNEVFEFVITTEESASKVLYSDFKNKK